MSSKKALKLPKPKKGKGIGKKLKTALAVGIPLAWTALGIAGNVLQGRQDNAFNAYHDALAGGALSKRTKKALKYTAITASVVASGVLAYLYGPTALKLAGTKLKALGSYLRYLPFFASRSPNEVPISEVIQFSPLAADGDYTRTLEEFEAQYGPVGPLDNSATTLHFPNALSISITQPEGEEESTEEFLRLLDFVGSPSPNKGNTKWVDDTDAFSEFVARSSQDVDAWQPDPEMMKRLRSGKSYGQGMRSRARHLNQAGEGVVWNRVKTGAKIVGATALSAFALSLLYANYVPDVDYRYVPPGDPLWNNLRRM